MSRLVISISSREIAAAAKHRSRSLALGLAAKALVVIVGMPEEVKQMLDSVKSGHVSESTPPLKVACQYDSIATALQVRMRMMRVGPRITREPCSFNARNRPAVPNRGPAKSLVKLKSRARIYQTPRRKTCPLLVTSVARPGAAVRISSHCWATATADPPRAPPGARWAGLGESRGSGRRCRIGRGFRRRDQVRRVAVIDAEHGELCH